MTDVWYWPRNMDEHFGNCRSFGNSCCNLPGYRKKSLKGGDKMDAKQKIVLSGIVV